MYQLSSFRCNSKDGIKTSFDIVLEQHNVNVSSSSEFSQCLHQHQMHIMFNELVTYTNVTYFKASATDQEKICFVNYFCLHK